MKWITREKVKVDRVACPWLIKNFVDRDAEFVFLPRDTDWSKITDGAVYDVPGCELGHHGEDVSFDSILKKYNLTDPLSSSWARSYEPRTLTLAILIRRAKACGGSRTGLARLG
jgi:hypothetical protein